MSRHPTSRKASRRVTLSGSASIRCTSTLRAILSTPLCHRRVRSDQRDRLVPVFWLHHAMFRYCADAAPVRRRAGCGVCHSSSAGRGSAVFVDVRAPAPIDSNFSAYIDRARAPPDGRRVHRRWRRRAGPTTTPAAIAFARHHRCPVRVGHGLLTGTFENALGDGHAFTLRTIGRVPGCRRRSCSSSTTPTRCACPRSCPTRSGSTIATRSAASTTRSSSVPDQDRVAGASYARRFGKLGIRGGSADRRQHDLVDLPRRKRDLRSRQPRAPTRPRSASLPAAGARYDIDDHWHLRPRGVHARGPAPASAACSHA